jgi:hypothetical protein
MTDFAHWLRETHRHAVRISEARQKAGDFTAEPLFDLEHILSLPLRERKAAFRRVHDKWREIERGYDQLKQLVTPPIAPAGLSEPAREDISAQIELIKIRFLRRAGGLTPEMERRLEEVRHLARGGDLEAAFEGLAVLHVGSALAKPGREQDDRSWWHRHAVDLAALYFREIDPKAGWSGNGPPVRFVQAALRYCGVVAEQRAIEKAVRLWGRACCGRPASAGCGLKNPFLCRTHWRKLKLNAR